MKLNFTICAVLMMMFFSSFTYAQNEAERKEITRNYDVAFLKTLSASYALEFKKNQSEAMDFARKNNIPLVVEKPNGGIAILQRISEEGIPIYYSTDNRGAGITTRTNQLYAGGNLNIAVHGEGMLIGVWDGGRVLRTHQLLEQRVTQMDNPPTFSDHATHVTGTMIGSEVPQNGNARGMAFEAEALASDFSNDLSEMAALASTGLLLSNHSYGFSADNLPVSFFGLYDSKAAAVDDILFNAPYYMMVASAGNDRGGGYNPADNGYDLLTDQSVSKNNIVVAAVQQVNNYTGPSSVNMSSFSSFGPPDDGRVKPDISAKGVNVYSSTAVSTSSYANFSGTSMATPNVSGSLLLLQQIHRNLYGGFMKAATLKALAIHTASEAGVAPGPDYRFGWGLLNMEKAARTLLENNFRSTFEENTLVDGEIFTKQITAAGNTPLVVTVVWTDPAGSVQPNITDLSTPRLINDLDVRVVSASGTTNFPWKLDPASFTAPATKADNIVDNVEKVEINAPSGDYTISVSHKGSLTGGSQDYSIVISGIQEGDFAVVPQVLETSICDFEDASMTFNFFAAENYTGTTSLSVSGLPAGATGTFTPTVLNGEATFELLITDLAGTATGTYPLTITATGSDFNREVVVNLNITNAQPLPDVTLISPSEGEEEVPIYPNLSWTEVTGATYYEVELSETPNFDSVFFNANPESNSVSIPGLSPNTTYYWRVRAVNECVEGDFATGTFTTEGLFCPDPFTATDTPKNISTFPTTVNSVISIPADDDFLVADVNVFVDITHSYVGDFKLMLTSPSGTQVLLVSNECGAGNDVLATFDDTGSAFQCASIPPAIYGTFEPLEPLSNFIGEFAAGDWTLSVIDEYNGDGGSLNVFELQLCSSANMDVESQEIPNLSLYPNPAEDYFYISFPTAERKTTVVIYDLNGREIIKHQFEAIGNFDQKINTYDLAGGMYFVKIDNGHKNTVKKLIIE